MEPNKPGSSKTIRNLVIFSTIVLASGWFGRWVDGLTGNTESESLGMLVWILTPLLVTVLLRAFGGDGWKDFGLKPNFAGNWRWYLFSILVFPVVTALLIMVGVVFGWIRFSGFSAAGLNLFLQACAVGLLPQFLKNIFEEAPWRGYLAPKIYSLNLNEFAGHTLVGLVWGAWHIPYYLFFLDRTQLLDFTTLNLAAYIPLSIWIMISWSFVYGEIRLLTHSFWPAVLMHAIEDVFVFLLIAEQYIAIAPGTDWLISPMNGLLNSIIFIGIGIGLNRWRKRGLRNTSPTPARVVSQTI